MGVTAIFNVDGESGAFVTEIVRVTLPRIGAAVNVDESTGGNFGVVAIEPGAIVLVGLLGILGLAR